MKKTGELLKKVREEKGLSLHEIGLSLKINAKILKQIEEGEKDNLPAKTFLRGFVQSYANYLKIDSDEVLRIFSEEMGSTKPKQIPVGSSQNSNNSVMTVSDPKPEGAQGKNSSPDYTKNEFEFKNFGIGFLVILLLLSLIGVRKIVEKYQKESELEATQLSTEETVSQNPIPTANSNSTVVPGNTVAVSTNEIQKSNLNKPDPVVTAPDVAIQPTQPSKPPTIAVPPPPTATSPTTPSVAASVPNKPTPVATAPVASATSSATTPAPAQTPPPKPNPTVNATPPTVTPNLTAEKKPTPAAVPAKPSTEELKIQKSVEVVIEALDNVDVEVTMSTGKSEIIKLSPSQTQTIKSAAGVRLNFSNGGAVNLIVNGKDMGPPGDLGKPMRVSF